MAMVNASGSSGGDDPELHDSLTRNVGVKPKTRTRGLVFVASGPGGCSIGYWGPLRSWQALADGLWISTFWEQAEDCLSPALRSLL